MAGCPTRSPLRMDGRRYLQIRSRLLRIDPRCPRPRNVLQRDGRLLRIMQRDGRFLFRHFRILNLLWVRFCKRQVRDCRST